MKQQNKQLCSFSNIYLLHSSSWSSSDKLVAEHWQANGPFTKYDERCGQLISPGGLTPRSMVRISWYGGAAQGPRLVVDPELVACSPSINLINTSTRNRVWPVGRALPEQLPSRDTLLGAL